MSFDRCPISTKRVDANVVRISSAILALLVLGYLFSHDLLFMIAVAVELGLRMLIPKSPLTILITKLLEKLGTEPRYEDAAPKLFAAKLGALLALCTIALDPFVPLLAHIFASIFLGCIMLELLFEYCIGCKLYALLSKGVLCRR